VNNGTQPRRIKVLENTSVVISRCAGFVRDH